MISVFYICSVGLATMVIANPTAHLIRNVRDGDVAATTTATDATTTAQTCLWEHAIVGSSSLHTGDYDSKLKDMQRCFFIITLSMHFAVLPRESCGAWKDYTNNSGVFPISPTGGCEFKVYCDMCLRNQEGWIVIQRRVDESVSFEGKNWQQYKTGFGNYSGNYWMGLEKIHTITSLGTYDLFIGFKDGGLSMFLKRAYYKGFSVASEADNYRMTYTEFDAGMSNASNGLSMHRDKFFTTFDNDNDGVSVNCAEHSDIFYGGWWFGADPTNDDIIGQCYQSNLNGKYYADGGGDDGIKWVELSSFTSLTATIMAIRKVD